MNAPALAANQSPLETALREVHATLGEMLVAADEQYAAVVSRDRDRLESVTRLQERLTARLARAEVRRLDALQGASLAEAIARTPDALGARDLEQLRDAIATSVDQLRSRQRHTANLLAKSIELGRQTLEFLQRLVTNPTPAYNAHGLSTMRHSVLVDGRA